MTGVIVVDVNQGRWLQIQRYFAMPCKNAHQTPRPSNADHHPTVGGVFRGWHRAFAGLALMAGTVLVNLAPPNPYSAVAFSVWQQGHFLNFNGLTRLIATLWPFLTLPFLMLSARRH